MSLYVVGKDDAWHLDEPLSFALSAPRSSATTDDDDDDVPKFIGYDAGWITEIG